MAPIVTRRRFATGLAATISLAAERFSPALAEPPGFNFLVLGDWGHKHSEEQRRVARAMKHTSSTIPPRFVLSVGDNFYPGGVIDTTDPLWTEAFERVYDLKCPWYSILGNHDHRGNVDAQIAYSSKNPRWIMPSRFYRRLETIGGSSSAEFFFLDTTPLVLKKLSFWSNWVTRRDRDPQIDWLKSSLKSSAATWKIVAGHHPIVSGGPHRISSVLVERVKPLLERYGVQAYFNGHDHNLQHISADGVHYFTSGGGSVVRPPGQAVGAQFSLLGFMRASITPSALTVELIDDDGRLLHKARISAT